MKVIRHAAFGDGDEAIVSGLSEELHALALDEELKPEPDRTTVVETVRIATNMVQLQNLPGPGLCLDVLADF